MKRSATALVAAGMLALAFPLAALADDADGSLNDSMDYSESNVPLVSVDPALDLAPSGVDWVDTSGSD